MIVLVKVRYINRREEYGCTDGLCSHKDQQTQNCQRPNVVLIVLDKRMNSEVVNRLTSHDRVSILMI